MPVPKIPIIDVDVDIKNFKISFNINKKMHALTPEGERVYIGGRKSLYKVLKDKYDQEFYVFKTNHDITFITPSKSCEPVVAIYSSSVILVGENELGEKYDIPYTVWWKLAKEYLKIPIKSSKFKIKIPPKTRSFIVSGANYAGVRVRFKKVTKKANIYTAILESEDFRNPLYSRQVVRVWNKQTHTVTFNIDANQKLLSVGGEVSNFFDNRDLWRKIAESI